MGTGSFRAFTRSRRFFRKEVALHLFMLDAKKLALLDRPHSRPASFRIEWQGFSTSWARGLNCCKNAVIASERSLAFARPNAKSASEGSALGTRISRPQAAMPSSTTLAAPPEPGKWPSTTLRDSHASSRALIFRLSTVNCQPPHNPSRMNTCTKMVRGRGILLRSQSRFAGSRLPAIPAFVRTGPAVCSMDVVRKRTSPQEVHS
jgi:hypothetical protein